MDPTQNLSKVNTRSVTLADSNIKISASVKSIGTHLDFNLKMEKQLAAAYKTAWFHRYQISKIRKYLTEEQVKSVVHAHVTC